MGFLNKIKDAVRLKDNDDKDDEYYDDEEFDDLDDKPEQPKKRFFSKMNSTKKSVPEDEPDDLDPLPEEEERPSRSAWQSSIRPSAAAPKPAPVRKSRGGGGSMEVCVIKPTKVEDFREIADTLLSSCTVVLNLEGIDVELAQRIIDFSSGSCYAIGGGFQKVSSYIFILTPANVEISGDIQDLLGGAIPSMRSSF